MMNTEPDNLGTILSELAVTRAHEKQLLSRMAAVLDAPAPYVPDHLARTFAQAKEVFGGEAADFLTTAHWELSHEMPIRIAQDVEGAHRVEELLARISYGIPPCHLLRDRVASL